VAIGTDCTGSYKTNDDNNNNNKNNKNNQ
jgi:hypothetical protein